MMRTKHIIMYILPVLVLGVIVLIAGSHAFNNSNEDIDDEIASYEDESILTVNEQSTSTTKWHKTNLSVTTTPTSPNPTLLEQKSQAQKLSLTFVDLPQQVKSNESFVVKWRVDGPSGIKGEDTTVEVSYTAQSSTNNSSSSVSSESSQSFGSFVTPQTFNSNFSFGSEPGTIDLKITAIINDGQKLTAQDSIQLVN